jgi:hypothetical protein
MVVHDGGAPMEILWNTVEPPLPPGLEGHRAGA